MRILEMKCLLHNRCEESRKKEKTRNKERETGTFYLFKFSLLHLYAFVSTTDVWKAGRKKK